MRKFDESKDERDAAQDHVREKADRDAKRRHTERERERREQLEEERYA